MIKLRFSSTARKKLLALDRKTRRRIGYELFKFQPGEHVDVRKVEALRDCVRVAVDEWRIILELDHVEKDFIVKSVVQRKDAYK
ncbi:MAG: type II toxin-antitoxin system RelE/ParE family toxin [Candidatus Xenobiia bacterium LiM19]